MFTIIFFYIIAWFWIVFQKIFLQNILLFCFSTSLKFLIKTKIEKKNVGVTVYFNNKKAAP
jgi:hypothetical protein